MEYFDFQVMVLNLPSEIIKAMETKFRYLGELCGVPKREVCEIPGLWKFGISNIDTALAEFGLELQMDTALWNSPQYRVQKRLQDSDVNKLLGFGITINVGTIRTALASTHNLDGAVHWLLGNERVESKRKEILARYKLATENKQEAAQQQAKRAEGQRNVHFFNPGTGIIPIHRQDDVKFLHGLEKAQVPKKPASYSRGVLPRRQRKEHSEGPREEEEAEAKEVEDDLLRYLEKKGEVLEEEDRSLSESGEERSRESDKLDDSSEDSPAPKTASPEKRPHLPLFAFAMRDIKKQEEAGNSAKTKPKITSLPPDDFKQKPTCTFIFDKRRPQPVAKAPTPEPQATNTAPPKPVVPPKRPETTSLFAHNMSPTAIANTHHSCSKKTHRSVPPHYTDAYKAEFYHQQPPPQPPVSVFAHPHPSQFQFAPPHPHHPTFRHVHPQMVEYVGAYYTVAPNPHDPRQQLRYYHHRPSHAEGALSGRELFELYKSPQEHHRVYSKMDKLHRIASFPSPTLHESDGEVRAFGRQTLLESLDHSLGSQRHLHDEWRATRAEAKSHIPKGKKPFSKAPGEPIHPGSVQTKPRSRYTSPSPPSQLEAKFRGKKRVYYDKRDKSWHPLPEHNPAEDPKLSSSLKSKSVSFSDQSESPETPTEKTKGSCLENLIKSLSANSQKQDHPPKEEEETLNKAQLDFWQTLTRKSERENVNAFFQMFKKKTPSSSPTSEPEAEPVQDKWVNVYSTQKQSSDNQQDGHQRKDKDTAATFFEQLLRRGEDKLSSLASSQEKRTPSSDFDQSNISDPDEYFDTNYYDNLVVNIPQQSEKPPFEETSHSTSDNPVATVGDVKQENTHLVQEQFEGPPDYLRPMPVPKPVSKPTAEKAESDDDFLANTSKASWQDTSPQNTSDSSMETARDQFKKQIDYDHDDTKLQYAGNLLDDFEGIENREQQKPNSANRPNTPPLKNNTPERTWKPKAGPTIVDGDDIPRDAEMDQETHEALALYEDRLKCITLATTTSLTTKEIAQNIGRSQKFVSKWWKQHPNMVPKPKLGFVGNADADEWRHIILERKFINEPNLYDQCLRSFNWEKDLTEKNAQCQVATYDPGVVPGLDAALEKMITKFDIPEDRTITVKWYCDGQIRVDSYDDWMAMLSLGSSSQLQVDLSQGVLEDGDVIVFGKRKHALPMMIHCEGGRMSVSILYVPGHSSEAQETVHEEEEWR